MEHEAIELFVERAKAVLPGFTMTDADCIGIAKLCAQLDGIPLAIELAAARLRTFGVTELLQILEDRFRLLTTGSSVAEPRHRTLQALVDWSYQLLTPDESAIWTAASLFAGEFTAAAAVEVCAGPTHAAPDVRFVLASLVDKSMLLSTSTAGIHRYRLLVTLREYAGQRLAESTDRRRHVERYVDRYLRIAEQFRRDWFSSRQVAAFTAVHDERENLRAALTYSQVGGSMSAAGARIVTALHFYWQASSTLTEARRWLAAVIDSPGADETIQARALWSSAIIAMVQNDIDATENFARRARDIAIASGDPSSEGYADIALGMAALCRHDIHGGLAQYETALACHRAANDPQGIVATISGLLTALAQSNDAARANELWQEAMALCTWAGDQWNLAYLTFAHGYHAYTGGDLDRALEDQRISLLVSRPFSDRIVVAWALEVLSWIAAQRNEFEDAARMRGAAGACWASRDASVLGYGTMTDQRREVEALVRAALGDERTDELISIGSRTPGEVIVAEVLGAT